MDLLEAIRNRRSIRKFLSQPVETEKVTEILEAGRLAPSWKNMQCWRFLVLTSQKKKEALLSAFPEENPAIKSLTQAPVVIVVCANPLESGIESGKEYYMADAAIAFEHICLAAFAQGLGTCWMGWFDENNLKQALGIPNDIRVVGLTPLGYPDQDPKPRPRKELSQLAYNEVWGTPYGC